MPFESDGLKTVCDDIYTPGVNYIYIPFTKAQNIHPQSIRNFQYLSRMLFRYLSTCREPILRLLCHYYYPPCGKRKDFHPPSSVCPEQCKAVTELCPEEWAEVVKQFQELASPEGLHLLDCNNTGKHLAPLPHCCSDLPLNLSMIAPPTHYCSQNTSELFNIYIS